MRRDKGEKGMKKIVVIGIILSLISIAIAPAITAGVVNATNDDTPVKITTQACGIQGFTDTTVHLSKEQYQDLQQYLFEFRTRLNQTTTKEEAVSLYKEAVMEVDTYGLLPRGMSVEQAQKLVTTGIHIQQVPTIGNKSFSDHLNIFCLFAAFSDNVVDFNLWVVAAALASQFVEYDSPAVLLVYLLFFVGFVKPLRFFNFLTTAGGGQFSFHFCLGLKGVTTGLDDISEVIGFTGLKIILNTHNALYLGFALLVKRDT